MKFWDQVIPEAIRRFETPFFLCAWQPVLSALKTLDGIQSTLPLKHWLSFKTQPVGQLIRNWRDLGLGLEVVSEYELLASLKEGYTPNRIVVNGVGKHAWLPKYTLQNLRVHFDSLYELEQLAQISHSSSWRVGLRIHPEAEFDPDETSFGGQFGLLPAEVPYATAILKRYGINLETVHFHLRSNVSSPESYDDALKEISWVCQVNDLTPLFVDCGGGLPIPGMSASSVFDLSQFSRILSTIPERFPTAIEVWMENGRFITSDSSILVLKVIDAKERRDCRYLICDGGRTNHALVSDWETHEIIWYPKESGSEVLTTICGPTCMAYDRLARAHLPSSIGIGDFIIWMHAGAYHIPWETRFSHGTAKVVWYDLGDFRILREKETFERWWGQWT
jgi:diaminopimelate decarboxylase